MYWLLLKHRLWLYCNHRPLIRDGVALAVVRAGAPMSTPTTAARLAALEARVAELEAINARLIACVSRFTAMFDDHSLAITEWAVEEFTARDQEAAETTAELEAAIRSRAPRGFKIPHYSTSSM